jgi:hypothetical protein
MYIKNTIPGPLLLSNPNINIIINNYDVSFNENLLIGRLFDLSNGNPNKISSFYNFTDSDGNNSRNIEDVF